MAVEIDSVCFRTCSNFEYNEYIRLLKSKYDEELSDFARYVEEVDSKILALHGKDYTICRPGGKNNA